MAIGYLIGLGVLWALFFGLVVRLCWRDACRCDEEDVPSGRGER